MTLTHTLRSCLCSGAVAGAGADAHSTQVLGALIIFFVYIPYHMFHLTF